MATANATQAAPAEPALIESLLRRERKKFVAYWTLLSEMRLQGELPDWIRRLHPNAGRHEDYDEQNAVQAEVDRAVHGERVPSRYTLGDDNDGMLSLYCRDGYLVFQGPASRLPIAHPDALSEFTRRQLEMYARALQQEVQGLPAMEAA